MGLPVCNLKERFDVRLTRDDDNWIHLELKPRKQGDRSSFRGMEVVLERKTLWIRRLWIEQPNGSTKTYDFQKPGGGSEESVTPESILMGLPDDYKKVDVGCPEDELRKLQSGIDDPPKKP